MFTPWNGYGARTMNGRWGRAPWSNGRAEAWSEMWTGWWRGPPARCERGLVRYLVLDAIATQPRHGYEVIQAVGEKSGGTYRPSPGVVYPTLQMLEELGQARTVVRGERKVYEITDAGRNELREHVDEVSEFYEGNADGAWQHADDVAQLGKHVGRVIRLFKRAMRRGHVRSSTFRKMHAVLDETLQKLEEVLSREEP